MLSPALRPLLLERLEDRLVADPVLVAVSHGLFVIIGIACDLPHSFSGEMVEKGILVIRLMRRSSGVCGFGKRAYRQPHKPLHSQSSLVLSRVVPARCFNHRGLLGFQRLIWHFVPLSLTASLSVSWLTP